LLQRINCMTAAF